jgi:hypothetical protein
VSFRYYLYISDVKVDMLLSQIDPKWARKRVTELNLGLKAVGARHTVENAGPDRFARLERVLRYLASHGDLGSVDEPGPYVRGVLPMQWGPVGDGDTVYFGGRGERTIVGLGGSTGHVLSTAPGETPTGHRLSGSLMPTLLRQLAATASEETADPDALGTIVRANSSLRGPTQVLEFVAKRMLHGPCPYPELYPEGDMAVLLGSPLYVAVAE